MIRALAAAALLALVTYIGIANARAHHVVMGDFRAFYCAGELAREHAFSYDQAAIAPCESRPVPGYFTAGRGTSLPAPLPGYAIALFEPLSLLQFQTAVLLWTIVTFAAIFGGLALVAALGWMPLDAAIVLATVLTGTAIVPPGELSGLAFLGIGLLAYGCERGHALARLSGLLLLALEPQIALCAYAVVLARREYWRELFVAVVVLGVVTLLAIGPQEAIAYVRNFIPAHIAAEIHRAQQYTIGWAIVQSGISTTVAIWTGRVCYAAAIVASALIGRRASGAKSIAAACALALAFGPFVHVNHLICALPAALAAGGPLGLIAAFLIAFPPVTLFADVLLIAIVPVAIYWVMRAQGAPARTSAYGALAAVLFVAALAAVSQRLGFTFVPGTAHGSDWAAYVARHNIVRGALIWIVKAPVWIGVAFAAIAASISAGRLQRRTGRNARQQRRRRGRAAPGIE